MKINDLWVFKALTISLLILSFHQQTVTADKFKIGVVLPLTVPLSFQGILMKNSAILAKEHFDIEDQLIAPIILLMCQL